jgi:hypothetical protein
MLTQVPETVVPFVNWKGARERILLPQASLSPWGEKLAADHAIDLDPYLACAARIAIALGATSFSSLVATSSRSMPAAIVG